MDKTEKMQGSEGDKSGKLQGVSKNGKRWRAQFCHQGKKYYLGTFDTPEQAHAEYLRCKRRFGC